MAKPQKNACFETFHDRRFFVVHVIIAEKMQKTMH